MATKKQKESKNAVAVLKPTKLALAEFSQAAQPEFITVGQLPPGMPKEFLEAAESYDSQFPPTPTFKQSGDTVWGFYERRLESVGKNESNMYQFVTPIEGSEGKQMFRWAMWGSHVVDDVFLNKAKIQEGDAVMVIFRGEIETGRGVGKDGDPRTVKLFDARVVRANKLNK